MKSIPSILVTLCLSLSAHAEAKKAAPAPVKVSPLTFAVKIFNKFKSGNRLFAAMKVDANATDREFLDELNDKYKGAQLPVVTNNGDESITYPGLDFPLVVVDLNKGLFKYDGQTIDLSGKKGIAVSIDELQKVLFPKKNALLELLLPSANASIDPMLLMSGIMGVGGIATVLSACGSDAQLACTVGGFMSGFGITSFIMELMKNNNNSANMNCPPGQQSMTMNNGAGQFMNGVNYSPGTGYGFQTPFSQVPMGMNQPMFAQNAYNAVCQYPTTLTPLNYAYQQPYLPPGAMAPTAPYAARPFTGGGVGAPPIILPAARMPSSRSRGTNMPTSAPQSGGAGQ